MTYLRRFGKGILFLGFILATPLWAPFCMVYALGRYLEEEEEKK